MSFRLHPRLKSIILQTLKHRRRRPGRPRVLISYIVRPFLGISHHHPNELDARCIYEVFEEADWDITVVDYRRRRVSGHFDLAIGFGAPFANCLREGNCGHSVYYATGAPFYFQSAGSIQALRRYLDAGGNPTVDEGLAYMRYTYTDQPLQMVMCDCIVCLGGDRNLFEYGRLAPTLPLTPIVGPVGAQIRMDVERATSGGFLWFGGNGPVHKGLDLCMAALSETGDYLAVAGTPESAKVLRSLPLQGDFEHHGFLERGSDMARSVLERCRFVILPSASEANPTSVIAAVLDGELLPIISRECAMSDERDLIIIETLDLKGVRNAIEKAKSLSPEEIVARVTRIRERFLALYSKDRVKMDLVEHLGKFML